MKDARGKLIDAIVKADLMGDFDKSMKTAESVYKYDLKALRQIDINDRFKGGDKILFYLIGYIDAWIEKLEDLSKGAVKLGKRASLVHGSGYIQDNKEIG